MADTSVEAAPGDNPHSAYKKNLGKYMAAAPVDMCKKCDKRVYDMEKIAAGPVVYHKSCFRCTHCNRILSVGNYTIGDNKPYCHPHYMSLFKEKGKYEFGVEKKGETHGLSAERRSSLKTQDSTDSPAAASRRNIELTDRKPLTDIPPLSPEADLDKRRFSGFANMKAKFESSGGTSQTASPKKTLTGEVMITQESVKERMAKYAALQAEKKAEAAKNLQTTTHETPAAKQREKRVHLYDDVAPPTPAAEDNYDKHDQHLNNGHHVTEYIPDKEEQDYNQHREDSDHEQEYHQDRAEDHDEQEYHQDREEDNDEHYVEEESAIPYEVQRTEEYVEDEDQNKEYLEEQDQEQDQDERGQEEDFGEQEGEPEQE